MDTNVITHEMFMRFDKGKYEWRLTEGAPVIPIPEDAAVALTKDTKTRIKTLCDIVENEIRLLKDSSNLFSQISEIVRHIRENKPTGEKLLADVFEKMKSSWGITEYTKLFESFVSLVRDFNSFFLMNMLFDAAKSDPNGNWVSASDDPVVPGQLKIGG